MNTTNIYSIKIKFFELNPFDIEKKPTSYIIPINYHFTVYFNFTAQNIWIGNFEISHLYLH